MIKRRCGSTMWIGQGPGYACGEYYGLDMLQCEKCKAGDLEFPVDELGELDIAVIMLRNHGYNHLAESVALARKALTREILK